MKIWIVAKTTLFLSIKLIDMNIAKIEKIIELQNRCNSQIDVYGSADAETTDEMLLLVDSLSPEEESKLLEMYYVKNNIH